MPQDIVRGPEEMMQVVSREDYYYAGKRNVQHGDKGAPCAVATFIRKGKNQQGEFIFDFNGCLASNMSQYFGRGRTITTEEEAIAAEQGLVEQIAKLCFIDLERDDDERPIPSQPPLMLRDFAQVTRSIVELTDDLDKSHELTTQLVDEQILLKKEVEDLGATVAMLQDGDANVNERLLALEKAPPPKPKKKE